MENKINVAQLLKDCPKGMELDCTMYEDASFAGITENLNFPIRVKINVENVKGANWTKEITLTSEGKLGNHPNAKCVIFPKGKTTWEGFQRPFKDGDILIHGDCIFIYNGFENDINYGTYVIIDCYGAFAVNIPTKKYGTRFATEEEKQKLFDVIKANGYKWNDETKILEKLPRFKVGDRIKSIYNGFQYDIKELTDTHYTLVEVEEKFKYTEPIIEDKNWELIPSKFDITTLVPFESKVLVRNDENQRWLPAFWGYKRDNGYATTFGWCQYCIPYEGNEHLLGKTDDCDDFYKTWEK